MIGGIWDYVWDFDISPDGHWFALSLMAQIYKIKINGTNLMPLTSSGRNFFPDWSPDGKRIAYHAKTEPYGIWIIDSNGSNRKHLGLGDFPNWSPNMTQFIYVGLGDEIYVADTTGKNVKQLTTLGPLEKRNPVFSPDGKKIASSWQREANPPQLPQIWVMNSNGTGLKQLTGLNAPRSEGGVEPCWSPDGKKIVYVNCYGKNGCLWIMNDDGTDKKQLTFLP